jgi:hypothetical protein
MSHGVAVYLAASSLPPLAKLQQRLKSADLPLSTSESWDWKIDSGWLPMQWRGVESGFEVELGTLDRGEKQALKRAGHVGFDRVVLVTTRGWQSLQCGVCFAAALAEEVGGVISEEEDDFIAASDAVAWARKSVEDADRAMQSEAERDAAVAELKQTGNVEATFRRMLAERVGQPVAQVQLLSGRLLVLLTDRTRIVGKAWTMRFSPGEALEHGHYDAVRAEQMKVLRSDASEEAKSKQVAALEKKLRSAEGKDHKSSSRAEELVGSWVGATVVALEHRPGKLLCSLDGGRQFELSCGGSDFAIGLNGITFRIADDTVTAS